MTISADTNIVLVVFIPTNGLVNQALRFQASQGNQNAVLMAAMDSNKAEILRRTGADCPVPAYWVQPPTPVQVPCNSCGCGC